MGMEDSSERPPAIVTDAGALERLCGQLREAGRFAFDTEFVAEDTFRPNICLIQVATDSHCALIDPMGGLDAKPLWELVADDRIEIIVHSGAEDLGLCWLELGKPAARVFDVQIAAGLVGMDYPISLARLVKSFAKARLPKSQTLTDWRRRPLSPDQISYAVADVKYLPHAHRELAKRLASLGRTAWLEEECVALCETSRPGADDIQQMRRVRGSGSLEPRELAIAHALIEERDKLALSYNRPARAVLKDHLLIEIARRGWTDPAKLRSLRGLSLSNTALDRLGDAIRKAKAIPVEDLPTLETKEEHPTEDVLSALMSAVILDHCRRHQIAWSLLANKRDIRALVEFFTRQAAESALPATSDIVALLSGWRGDVVGPLATRVLQEGATLRVAGTGLDRRIEMEPKA